MAITLQEQQGSLFAWWLKGGGSHEAITWICC